MPRYLVQTASGSWYQVDTDEPKILRWSGHGIIGSRQPNHEASDTWQDMRAQAIMVPPIPGASMHFVTMDSSVITTAPVISRVIIENLSKRRSVPTAAEILCTG